MKKSYNDSGVSEDVAQNWVDRLQSNFTGNQDLLKKVVTGIGSYAAVYKVSEQQWMAASCDGVGTKLIWTKEGLGSYRDLAQDLIAMNANDVLCVGAKPTLFLDYLAVGSKALLKKGGGLDEFMKGLFDICASTGQVVLGGETAQLPDLYDEKDFDLAGFSVGFLSPVDYLGPEKINEGSQVWGWASSGPHSNGFTWLRKIFDSKKDASFIREQLMPPTKIYINEMGALKNLLNEKKSLSVLQGAYHLTGTGLHNLLRMQPHGRAIGFDLTMWKKFPKWIEEIQKKTQCKEEELLSTFNMGMGFVVVLEATFSEKYKKEILSLGLEHLGKVISQPEVRIGNSCLKKSAS